MFSFIANASATTIADNIVDEAGQAMKGVIQSVVDEDRRQGTSGFSQPDDSYAIDGQRGVDHMVRARLMGQLDKCLTSTVRRCSVKPLSL